MKNEKEIFPIEVFPETIQKFILEANRILRHPIEYLAASILFTSSVSIGKTIQLQVKKTWTESVLLYIVSERKQVFFKNFI